MNSFEWNNENYWKTNDSSPMKLIGKQVAVPGIANSFDNIDKSDWKLFTNC